MILQKVTKNRQLVDIEPFKLRSLMKVMKFEFQYNIAAKMVQNSVQNTITKTFTSKNLRADGFELPCPWISVGSKAICM